MPPDGFGKGTLSVGTDEVLGIVASSKGSPGSPQRPVMDSLPGADVNICHMATPGCCKNLNWATNVGVAPGKDVGVVAAADDVVVG